MFYISKRKLFNYFFERSFFGLVVINFCKEKVRTVFECSDFIFYLNKLTIPLIKTSAAIQ